MTDISLGQRFYKKRRELRSYVGTTQALIIISAVVIFGILALLLSTNDFILTFATEYHTIENFNPDSQACDPVSGKLIEYIPLQTQNSEIVDDYGCYSYYWFENDAPGQVLAIITEFISYTSLLAIAFGGVVILLGASLLNQSRKLKKTFREWEDEYLQQAYYLTVATTPQDDTEQGANIFRIVANVFPELREKDQNSSKWKGSITAKDDYQFDVFQVAESTLDSSEPQIFVAKHFGDTKVTTEKIQELCDKVKDCIKNDESIKERIKNAKNNHVMRLVIVAKNFDSFIESDDELNEIMPKFDSIDAPIDLISEDNEGNYLMEWIES